jgi:phosphoribosyl-ATP pyrophosphohydrolase
MSVLSELYEVVLERKTNKIEGSYTNYLYEKGLDKILKKVGEEATETIIAAKGNDKTEVVNEVADLTYHLLVMLAELNIPLNQVEAELDKRSAKISNKKAERKEINNL